MSEKVVLILVDGMRPDGLEKCGHPFVAKMKDEGSYAEKAQTVMPSVTLPCHMSLFHSVEPSRHGILTNIYTPQVRPINGLFEQLRLSKKACGMFYNWEELRDLARPDSIAYGSFISGHVYGFQEANQKVTGEAIRYINDFHPDFTFVYLGNTDEVGHSHGWMSEPYIASISESWDCIEKLVTSIPEEVTIIVTADHGGHDRSHGFDIPEDMTIPLFLKGKAFAPGARIEDATILDIAPTVTKLLGAEAAVEWEGKPLF